MCCIAGSLIKALLLPVKVCTKLTAKAGKAVVKAGGRVLKPCLRCGAKACKRCSKVGAHCFTLGVHGCGKSCTLWVRPFKGLYKRCGKKCPTQCSRVTGCCGKHANIWETCRKPFRRCRSKQPHHGRTARSTSNPIRNAALRIRRRHRHDKVNETTGQRSSTHNRRRSGHKRDTKTTLRSADMRKHVAGKKIGAKGGSARMDSHGSGMPSMAGKRKQLDSGLNRRAASPRVDHSTEAGDSPDSSRQQGQCGGEYTRNPGEKPDANKPQRATCTLPESRKRKQSKKSEELVTEESDRASIRQSTWQEERRKPKATEDDEAEFLSEGEAQRGRRRVKGNAKASLPSITPKEAKTNLHESGNLEESRYHKKSRGLSGQTRPLRQEHLSRRGSRLQQRGAQLVDDHRAEEGGHEEQEYREADGESKDKDSNGSNRTAAPSNLEGRLSVEGEQAKLQEARRRKKKVLKKCASSDGENGRRTKNRIIGGGQAKYDTTRKTQSQDVAAAKAECEPCRGKPAWVAHPQNEGRGRKTPKPRAVIARSMERKLYYSRHGSYHIETNKNLSVRSPEETALSPEEAHPVLSAKHGKVTKRQQEGEACVPANPFVLAEPIYVNGETGAELGFWSEYQVTGKCTLIGIECQLRPESYVSKRCSPSP